MPRVIEVPSHGLVVLLGVSSAGKSTFAARNFRPTEILSSDAFRAMVSDDPTDQQATEAAFELLHATLRLRLANRRLTVVDATNVESWARQRLLAIARRWGRPAVAVVLDTPLEVVLERNAARPDRDVAVATIRRQARWLERSLAELPREGYQAIHHLRSADEIATAVVERS